MLIKYMIDFRNTHNALKHSYHHKICTSFPKELNSNNSPSSKFGFQTMNRNILLYDI